MKKILLVLCVTIMLAFMLVSCSKDHTAVFNANNGSSYDNVSFDKEDYDDSMLPSPEKKGHTFAGWYMDRELTKKFDISNITEDMEVFDLFAKYTVNSYKVSVVDNEEIREYNFVYGDTINLVAPTNPEMSFGGFYLDKDYTVPFTNNTMGDKNIVLYVKWVEPQVKIIYVTNSDDNLNEDSVGYSGLGSFDYQTPKKTGHTFEGWYTDEGLKVEYDPSNVAPKTASVTLYAKYSVNTYRVIVHSMNSTSEYSFKYGSPIALDEALTLKNYRFKGYYASSDYSEAFALTAMPANDVDVYVLWQEAVMDISFVTGTKESIGTKIVSLKDKEQFVLPTPKKEGYTFAGWYTDSGYNSLFDINNVNEETLSVTLYAKYVLNAYKITVIDGENRTEYIHDYNEEIKLNIPSKQYYVFGGFFKDSSYDGEPFTETRMPAEDIKLYVLWSYAMVDITYNTNVDGVKADPVSVKLMDIVDYELPTLTKKGHTFIEWCTDEALTTPFDPTALKDSAKVTLYAKFVINEYKLTVDRGDMKVKYNLEYDSKIELETPVRENYVFVGFFSNSAMTEPFNMEYMPDDDVKVYVKWKEAKVTFVYNNNTDYPIPSVTEAIIRIDRIVHPTPAKPYHKFIGWYVDSALTTPYDKSYVTDKMTTVNLYAKYTEHSGDSYVVTVRSNIPDAVVLTGNTVQTVTKASEFEAVTIEENIGYKFLY